jgi:hypothetical protein
MIIAKIHSGEDSIILQAENVSDLQVIAEREVKKRGWVDPWSEILKESGV